MGSRGRTTCLPVFSVTRLWFSGHIWQFLPWSLNLIVGVGFGGEFFYAACQNLFVNCQNLMGLSQQLSGCSWGIFENFRTDQSAKEESLEFNILSVWRQNQSGSLKHSKQSTSVVKNRNRSINWSRKWVPETMAQMLSPHTSTNSPTAKLLSNTSTDSPTVQMLLSYPGTYSHNHQVVLCLYQSCIPHCLFSINVASN